VDERSSADEIFDLVSLKRTDEMTFELRREQRLLVAEFLHAIFSEGTQSERCGIVHRLGRHRLARRDYLDSVGSAERGTYPLHPLTDIEIILANTGEIFLGAASVFGNISLYRDMPVIAASFRHRDPYLP